MIVVVSQNVRRGTAKDLQREFQKLYSACKKPSTGSDYMKGAPEKRDRTPVVGVFTHLNETAGQVIRDVQPHLESYYGSKPKPSLLPGEWANM